MLNGGSRDRLRFFLEQIDLVVTLGANAARIDGVVVASQDQPVPAAAVALVTADVNSRHRSRSVTALADGSFAFDNVAPGDYVIYAWPELFGAAYYDETFMRAWEGKGSPVHVESGDELTGRILVLER